MAGLLQHLEGATHRAWHVAPQRRALRSEEHTSELQSPFHLVCRLLLVKKKDANHEARSAYRRSYSAGSKAGTLQPSRAAATLHAPPPITRSPTRLRPCAIFSYFGPHCA